MIRNWKLFGLQTLLAGALASSPVLGETKNGVDKGKDAAEPDQIAVLIKQQLDDIKKLIEANNKGMDKKLDDLSKAMDDKLKKLNDSGYSLELAFQKQVTDNSGQIKEIRDQIAKLQQELDALKARPNDQVARYVP